MEALWQQLEESLLTHGRPTLIAFHFYELLSEAGYNDKDIQEVAHAMAGIVA